MELTEKPVLLPAGWTADTYESWLRTREVEATEQIASALRGIREQLELIKRDGVGAMRVSCTRG